MFDNVQNLPSPSVCIFPTESETSSKAMGIYKQIFKNMEDNSLRFWDGVLWLPCTYPRSNYPSTLAWVLVQAEVVGGLLEVWMASKPGLWPERTVSRTIHMTADWGSNNIWSQTRNPNKNSLAVQWLTMHIVGACLIPAQETRSLHAMQHGQKKKR